MTVIEEAWVAPMAGPPSQDDIAAIEACVRDYYEGWFAGDGERMARAVHPALANAATSTPANALREVTSTPHPRLRHSG